MADVVLVGGGLQSGLAALALLHARPELELVLVASEPRLGGEHTWAFHEESVAPFRAWLAPLLEHRWPRYRVTFPGMSRTVELGYAACSPARLDAVVSAAFQAAPNASLRLGVAVAEVVPHAVALVSGERIEARLVVDARPPSELQRAATGYQKFVGLEVEVDRDLDRTTAELMDATVPQLGGFRFVHCLPLGPRRAFVEDTRFTNGPDVDRAHLRAEVLAWCAARGLGVTRVVREEGAVVPMPWRSPGPIARRAPLVGGLRGGWFHPAVGESLPVAARLAAFIAGREPEAVFGDHPGGDGGAAFDELARGHEAQARFAFLLNDLLFNATEPDQRWKVFRHFYELGDELVLRFQGAELSPSERRKVFLRRPPPGVSYLRAMAIFAAWGFR